MQKTIQASESKTASHAARWGELLCAATLVLTLSSGCGQIFIRQDGCSSGSDSGIDVECCDGCDLGPTSIGHARWALHCQQSDGEPGHRFHRASDRLSECWYRSPMAQWIAKKRDEKNAPPFPKFHPVPTRPALHPEQDSADGYELRSADGFGRIAPHPVP